MDIEQVALAFAVAAVVAAASTPLASRLALTLGVVDKPNERKVSRRAQMPLLGGLAVALGTGVAIAIALLWMPEGAEGAHRIEGFLIGGWMVLMIGAFDDRWALSAWPKLLVQIAAAVVAVQHGYMIESFREPILGTDFDLPWWFGVVVSLVWIVGVSNAMNLIDGLDGLSTGVGAIIAATLALVCWQAEQMSGLLLGAALLGALLGFLPYNFPPARIFLGDAGALFIGFSLALVSLEGYLGGYRKASVMAFLVPLLALAVPLLDTLTAIVRRARAGLPIMAADRAHMHHRLLESEGSSRGAVLSLYFVTACFCVIAVSFTRLEGYVAFMFLIAVVVLTVRLVRNIGMHQTDPLPSRGGGNPADAASDSPRSGMEESS